MAKHVNNHSKQKLVPYAAWNDLDRVKQLSGVTHRHASRVHQH